MINELKDIPPSASGFLLSVCVAALRVIFNQEETSAMRIVLESLLCGALTLTAGSAIEAAGYDSSWTLFAGGLIGFMGSQTIRVFANRFITKKIDE